VRIFVAVFPPPEVRRALARAAHELPVVGEVRWVRPENVHLTLKFLGDVAENDLGRIAEALEPVRLRHGTFEAGLSGLGAFPSARRARILWAGIGEGSESLRALARDVEASLEPLGFEHEDRAYVPHLTLGRARGRPVALEAVEFPSPVNSFTVRNLELVESVLGGAGSAYSTLVSYPLSEDRDQGPD
jgi:RNA 2',3'-cyclic 3'-phosphodiesterase